MCRPLDSRVALLALVIGVGCLLLSVPSRAQEDSKVAPFLLDLIFYVEEQQGQGGGRAQIPLPGGLALDSSGRVPVVITLTEITAAYLEELRVLSAVVQTQDARSGRVRAFISLRRVRDLAKRPWVLGIRLPSYGG